MKLLKMLLGYIILTPLMFAVTYADTINGKLEFIKKPPIAGVVYLMQTTSNGVVAEMDQNNKDFTKKIITVTPDSKIVFKNSDSVEHNIFAHDRVFDIRFDVGLMSLGSSVEMPVTWKDNTLIRIGCKIHPKMRSYIANIPSEKYHAFVFDKAVKEYSFSIKDVPEGVAELVLLLPKYDGLKLDIGKGESKTVDVLKKEKLRGHLSLVRE